MHVLESDELLHLALSVPRSMLLLTPGPVTILTGTNGTWKDGQNVPDTAVPLAPKARTTCTTCTGQVPARSVGSAMRQHLLDLWAIVERLPVPLPVVSPYSLHE